MLSRAHGFNYIPNHPNLHIVGMESALKPIGGHGRNLKFYPSPNRQSQDTNVDKQPTTSTGIIYDIPLGADLQSFQKTFNQNGQLIKTLYQVTNKNKGPTECVKIIFNTSTAPTLLRADKDYTVHPCRIPYLRCNQCQEHGHSTNTCPNKHTKCPHCSGPHTHDQCTSNYYKCANCSGNHGAAYKKCTAYLEHKEQIDKLNQTNEFTWTERRQDPAYHRHARKIQSLMNIKEFPLLKKQTKTPLPQTIKYHDQPQTAYITMNQLKDILTDVVDTNMTNLSKQEKKTENKQHHTPKTRHNKQTTQPTSA